MQFKIKSVRVLFAAAEAAPLVKVGGLGDVIGSLPKALNKLGLDVRLALPFYATIGQTHLQLQPAAVVQVRFDDSVEEVAISQTLLPDSTVPVYLFKNQKYLSGGGIYSSEDAVGRFQSEIERFAFFSEAVVEFLKVNTWQPQIIHCHDYHTGLIPHLLKSHLQFPAFNFQPQTIFTIHNLANQGISDLSLLNKLKDLKPNRLIAWDAADDNLDLILQGILSANLVTTVSPTYAQEIQTPDFGEGLHEILKEIAGKGKLLGILNGIDTEVWHPTLDKYLPATLKFPIQNDEIRHFKQENRKALQEELKFATDPRLPLLGMITRLAYQKGIDLVIQFLTSHFSSLTSHFQIVILGKGDQGFEDQLTNLHQQYPNRLAFSNSFDERLAHLIYAGTDFFLMPSRFEPCGLGQMIAQHYGSIPIVRAVGGLKDTVENGKTGFVFEEFNLSSLAETVNEALEIYQTSRGLSMMQNCLNLDHSWEKSAAAYLKLYQKLVASSQSPDTGRSQPLLGQTSP